MNERTKRILSYVACGLGGLALGVALLGGLSYCSVSEKAEQTKVNTILTKRNAPITTEGGYNGYRFSVDCTLSNAEYNDYRYAVYDIYSNYTLTLNTEATGTLEEGTFESNVSMINTAYSNAKSINSGYNKFVYYESYSSMTATGNRFYFYYFSFVPKSGNDTNKLKCFVCPLDSSSFISFKLSEWANAYTSASSPLFLTIDKATSFLRFPSLQTSFVFQDVESYYSELGYQDGYEDGYPEGNSVGYSSGYAEGYETGNSEGYSSGYADGFRSGYMNTYYAFTSLKANINSVWNMAEIPWHSRYDTLVTADNFNDFPFFDLAHLQIGIYINWAYLALFRDTVTMTPYWVYAQRYTTSNQNNRYQVCIHIAPADEETIQEDGTIGETTGAYILQSDSVFQLSTTSVWTAPNRCRLVGFLNDTEDIYTDWFDNGYLIPEGIEVDTNAYEEGYRQGQLDANNDTNVQNVFSLLTPAFTAVGGFFNLKIFGFLPLYWFFLAPLFVALITLLLRMVKH